MKKAAIIFLTSLAVKCNDECKKYIDQKQNQVVNQEQRTNSNILKIHIRIHKVCMQGLRIQNTLNTSRIINVILFKFQMNTVNKQDIMENILVNKIMFLYRKFIKINIRIPRKYKRMFLNQKIYKNVPLPEHPHKHIYRNDYSKDYDSDPRPECPSSCKYRTSSDK